MGVRGDVRMVQTALRRFPTEILIEKAIEATLRGLESGDPRAEATAVKNVIAMESLNQRDEHKVIDVRVVTRNDQLPGIAAELGVDFHLVERAARNASGSAGGDEAQVEPSKRRK